MAKVQIESVIPICAAKLSKYMSKPVNWLDNLPRDIQLNKKQVPNDFKEHQSITFELLRFGITRNFSFVTEYNKLPEKLELRQITGIYKKFNIISKIKDHGEEQSLLIDLVEYELPFGLLGTLVDDVFWKKDLKYMIKERHELISKAVQTEDWNKYELATEHEELLN